MQREGRREKEREERKRGKREREGRETDKQTEIEALVTGNCDK